MSTPAPAPAAAPAPAPAVTVTSPSPSPTPPPPPPPPASTSTPMDADSAPPEYQEVEETPPPPPPPPPCITILIRRIYDINQLRLPCINYRLDLSTCTLDDFRAKLIGIYASASFVRNLIPLKVWKIWIDEQLMVGDSAIGELVNSEAIYDAHFVCCQPKHYQNVDVFLYTTKGRPRRRRDTIIRYKDKYW